MESVLPFPDTDVLVPGMDTGISRSLEKSYDLRLSNEMCVACSARGELADSAGRAIP